jgi:hypothetical protein
MHKLGCTRNCVLGCLVLSPAGRPIEEFGSTKEVMHIFHAGPPLRDALSLSPIQDVVHPDGRDLPFDGHIL